MHVPPLGISCEPGLRLRAVTPGRRRRARRAIRPRAAHHRLLADHPALRAYVGPRLPAATTTATQRTRPQAPTADAHGGLSVAQQRRPAALTQLSTHGPQRERNVGPKFRGNPGGGEGGDGWWRREGHQGSRGGLSPGAGRVNATRVRTLAFLEEPGAHACTPALAGQWSNRLPQIPGLQDLRTRTIPPTVGRELDYREYGWASSPTTRQSTGPRS